MNSDADLSVVIAREQLARMRGMTGLYHRQFFSDVRFALLLIVALFAAAWWGIEELFLVVPFVALWGACQTAFDASYLIFSRHYADALERWLNGRLEEPILVAAQIEDAYLFPLERRKVVTVPIGGPGSWFGFMTAFITVGGVLAASAGLWMGSSLLRSLDRSASVAYLGSLGGLTVAALLVGTWWFVGGVGERRINSVLEPVFGTRQL